MRNLIALFLKFVQADDSNHTLKGKAHSANGSHNSEFSQTMPHP